MKIFFAILALAVGASAIIPGGGSSLAELEAARAAHLGEVSRISGERLAALSAALARAGQPAPVIVSGLASSAGEVAAARAAHLAEVARISGELLGALNTALDRAGLPAVSAPGLGGAPQPIQDNPDVALARAIHLAEVARQNGAALGALNAALARAGQIAVGVPQPIRDNPDVAAARAAHLAEVARQNNAALAAILKG